MRDKLARAGIWLILAAFILWRLQLGGSRVWSATLRWLGWG